MASVAPKGGPNRTARPTPRWEVADIFCSWGDTYRKSHRLPLSHLKVMHAIEVCRTAYLGGHLERCNACGFERPAYNSCRNRHCPKCQALAKAQWLKAREAELLPVRYFHAVFTLPHELNTLVQENKTVIYDLLYQSVSETLKEFAADPTHGLGGKLGFTAILHTWDQKMCSHIHLHCLIPAGVLSLDGHRWVHARKNFLFSVKALSKAFRGKFIDHLKGAFDQGAIRIQESFATLLGKLWKKDWIVYSKRPFAGPKKTLDYLGRYTHRVAISNHRITELTNGFVSFQYRDRRDENRQKIITLPAEEFIRRFLLHVLPTSFTRIRHFGFLANNHKKDNLERCRKILGENPAPPVAEKISYREMMLRLTGRALSLCPQCKTGEMLSVATFPSPVRLNPTTLRMMVWNTS